MLGVVETHDFGTDSRLKGLNAFQECARTFGGAESGVSGWSVCESNLKVSTHVIVIGQVG